MAIQLDPFMRARWRNTVSTTSTKVTSVCPSGFSGGQLSTRTTTTYSEGPNVVSTVGTGNYCTPSDSRFFPRYMNEDFPSGVRVQMITSGGGPRFAAVPSASEEDVLIDFYVNGTMYFTHVIVGQSYALNPVTGVGFFSRHIYPGSGNGSPYVPGYTWNAADVFKIVMRVPAYNVSATSSRWPTK